MAVTLPDGTRFYVSKTFKAQSTVTGITNAADPVVSVSGGGGQLATGDVVVIDNDWSNVRERAFKTGSGGKLLGVDTTDTAKFPPTSAAGTLRAVATWQALSQVTEVSSSGGEQNFVTYRFIENNYQSQLPSASSPITLTLTLGDDPADEGQKFLLTASEARQPLVLRATLPTAAEIYYYGYLGFQPLPSMSADSIMTVQATFSISGSATRYN
jgi:hypothetical protein